MECKWTNSAGDKCKRETFKDSEYCLFHKPKKNEEESFIFWSVINFDPFSRIRNELKYILYHCFIYDGEDELLQNFLKTGIISVSINNEIKLLLKDDINQSISEYLNNSHLHPSLHKVIIKQWEISGIHGSNSGFFSGFIFPPGGFFDYKYCKLNQSNEFLFIDVVFEKECWFENYNFGRNAVNFINVKIEKEVSFENTIFDGNVVFNNVNLNTHYGIIDKYPFNNSQFNGQKLAFHGGSISDIYGIKLSENTNLIIDKDVQINTLRLGDVTDNVMVNVEKETFLIAKNQANRRGDYKLASEYRYKEREAERKQIIIRFKQQYRQKYKINGKIRWIKYLMSKGYYESYLKLLWNLIAKYTIGYGEKPTYALISSLLFIFLFGIIYYCGDLITDSSFSSSLFFSIVTYTTVGYGNNTPKCALGEIVCSTEMFLGVTFIAIWTATLIRKMIR
jgi:hypothetical protein